MKKQYVLMLTFGSLIYSPLSSTEQAQKDANKTKVVTYNKAATEELRNLFATLPYCDDYKGLRQSYVQKRNEIKYLLYMGANPNECTSNAGVRMMESSLMRALFYDDCEMTRLSLECGANPNRQGDFVPLYCAESVKAAKLLIKNGAKVPDDFVHSSFRQCKNPELIGFFCNDKNQTRFDERLLHELFSITGRYRKYNVQIAALFIWFKLNPYKQIFVYKQVGNQRTLVQTTPMDGLAGSSPEYVHKVERLTTLVPQFKKEKKEQYIQSVASLLKAHIAHDSAGLVVDYAKPFTKPVWDETRWPEINQRMKQSEAAEKIHKGSTCSIS